VADTTRKNTEARARGGVVRSSEEALVMRGERRDDVDQSSSAANPPAGMSGRTSTKPYVIAKRAVWEAYQQVKANRGTAGVDEETVVHVNSATALFNELVLGCSELPSMF
jgi:hypothetical protein